MSNIFKRYCSFWLLSLLLLWFTHAISYFVHEYGHSFAAWMLGYRANPFAITYGAFNVRNILLQSQVDDGVDYQVIFDQGKASIAAFIAFAGVGVGSLSLYLSSRGWTR